MNSKKKAKTVRKAAPKAKSSEAPATAVNAANGTGGWVPTGAEVGIRVRMYRVGFGDFFLISLLLAPDKLAHIIVDCGVFKGTSGEGDIGSIEAAVADMAGTTQGEIALIMMTHRHADHIAGFARCAETYKKLKVAAVWMPIWESQYSATAMKFQAQLLQTATSLRSHFAGLTQPSDDEVTARKFMENAIGPLAAAGGSNAAALQLLKQGFTGVTPGYYKAGDTPTIPQVLRDAGLEASILGPPPIDDLDLMKLMDLQKGVGEYLAGEGEGNGKGPYDPFGPAWEVTPPNLSPNDAKRSFTLAGLREWRTQRSLLEFSSMPDAEAARQRMERALQASQPIAALLAATQLNSFLNNQSLVVLFKFKNKKLLFVGDAQAGNWEHWLYQTDAPDKKGDGAVSGSAEQILTSLDFYKVGHHGSTNATPKVVVDSLGAGAKKFAAMCSTQKGVYGTESPGDPSKGTEVPRVPLLNALEAKCALVRSDQVQIKANGKVIAPAAPAPLPASGDGYRFDQGDLWVDCYL